MEIVHNSHDHPLLYTDGESEDNQDEPVVCWGCENQICGPRLSCFTCNFHLHKSCTKLPPSLLAHPLHPQHALSLLPRPSYPAERYICDACDGRGHGFVYHCSQCDGVGNGFDLHIMCALSVDQKGNVVSESTGKKDYFQYGLHQHLLVLEEEQSAPLEANSIDCFRCIEPIPAPYFFCSRSPCKFRIHKFCPNLPKQIKNTFLHPDRSFFLVPRSLFFDPKTHRLCEICGKEVVSSYICKELNLFIHPKCASSNPRDAMKRVGEKHIQHRSHHHNLTLLVDEKHDHPSCCLCMEDIGSSLSYGCELCPFILHKSCAELPSQIKSHLHPEHSLILFTTTQSRRITYCDCCGTEVSKLNYRCLQCGFTLHVNCFFSLHDFDSERKYDHHHSFVEIKTFRKLACDACGKEGYFSPWQCTTCHLMVHKKCADLSRLIRLDRHNHVLKLTYYLSFVHECDKVICQLCYKEVNVDYAVYYCHLCKYVVHLSCGQKIGVVISEEDTQEDSNISFVESSLEESHNFIANSGAIALLAYANKNGRIQHFTHLHELTLNEQDPENHIYCEGCVTLISSPFYSCKDCGFYLHKQCAEFPKTKKFSFDPHPLYLNPVEASQYCHKCDKTYNGFMYSCQFKDCFLKIDLHCVKLMEGLDHPCHEHRLFFPDPNIRRNETCRGCGRRSHFILVCSECKYVLGYCCAKLPHRVKHRYDEHLLILASKKEDESGEYYCEICENERDPKDWFYCCIQCDFFAHIKCALGDYPYIKYGTTLTFPFHDHPLIFVEQPARKPPSLCTVCGKHCYSRVLECLRCSFNVHFTRSCTDEII